MLHHKIVNNVKEAFVIGDVHGNIETVEALVNTLREKHGATDENIVFTGDYGDRGKDSMKVMEFVKQFPNKVKGNHEDMPQTFLEAGGGPWDTKEDLELWGINGGVTTLESFGYNPNDLTTTFSRETLKADFPWLLKFYRDLPLALAFPECVDEEGRMLFVSHSSLPAGDYTVDGILNVTGPEIGHIENMLLWHRGVPGKITDGFHVFGHTPGSREDITDYYANIDTGCVYAHSAGYDGKLTALKFPDLEIIKQDNIDLERSWYEDFQLRISKN